MCSDTQLSLSAWLIAQLFRQQYRRWCSLCVYIYIYIYFFSCQTSKDQWDSKREPNCKGKIKSQISNTFYLLICCLLLLLFRGLTNKKAFKENGCHILTNALLSLSMSCASVLKWLLTTDFQVRHCSLINRHTVYFHRGCKYRINH